MSELKTVLTIEVVRTQFGAIVRVNGNPHSKVTVTNLSKLSDAVRSELKRVVTGLPDLDADRLDRR